MSSGVAVRADRQSNGRASSGSGSGVVKIAVQPPAAGSGRHALLIEFNQRLPLGTIVQELCASWGIDEPGGYALQFSESNNRNYVTEKNRSEVKNGSVLTLVDAPTKTVEDILARMRVPAHGADALQKLASLSADATFVREFISKKGHDALISSIQAGEFEGAALAYALASFVELMDHGQISWDVLEAPFVSRVAAYVNRRSPAQDPAVVKSCLSVLENLVLNATGKHSLVEKEVSVHDLVEHLQGGIGNQAVQQNALALINALFSKADLPKKRAINAALHSKEVRNRILNDVIQTPGEVGAEMAHQLYVLQTQCLGLLEHRMVRVDPNDQNAQESIKELRRIAFENDAGGSPGDASARRQLAHPRDYKRLGFRNDANPLLDLADEQSPGQLALDCMLYFARNYNEAYTKVVLENSCRVDEHECPFGRTSVELVKAIVETLRIRETPSEQGQTYHPMFFNHDHPFEEFFCICVVLLNKTWKEMHATSEDLVKVFSVVREQISRALQALPMSLEKFRVRVNQLTYAEIRQIWQQERTNREEWESHARPIVELKEQITPEIMELIKQQRLSVLINGTRFTKYSSKGQRVKDKFWFIRLSPNHKVLHYGDCDEKSNPALEELGNKLPVTDVKSLVVGKECPHMKDARGRKSTHQLAFSVTHDAESLDVVAPDEQTFDYWTDGINALLGNKMVSKTCEKDLETLISMDIKLRLLDAEGIDIPQDPPPIPPQPDNFDFFFDLK